MLFCRQFLFWEFLLNKHLRFLRALRSNLHQNLIWLKLTILFLELSLLTFDLFFELSLFFFLNIGCQE